MNEQCSSEIPAFKVSNHSDLSGPAQVLTATAVESEVAELAKMVKDVGSDQYLVRIENYVV
jgi:hypothetical protein